MSAHRSFRSQALVTGPGVSYVHGLGAAAWGHALQWPLLSSASRGPAVLPAVLCRNSIHPVLILAVVFLSPQEKHSEEEHSLVSPPIFVHLHLIPSVTDIHGSGHATQRPLSIVYR